MPVEDETADLMHADEQAQEALDQAKRIQSDLQPVAYTQLVRKQD